MAQGAQLPQNADAVTGELTACVRAGAEAEYGEACATMYLTREGADEKQMGELQDAELRAGHPFERGFARYAPTESANTARVQLYSHCPVGAAGAWSSFARGPPSALDLVGVGGTKLSLRCPRPGPQSTRPEDRRVW